MYKKYFKRILDFTLSLIAIIVLSPVMIIISICIKLDTKGSILFKQERLGRGGKVFKIFKFRTMIMNAENIGDGLSIKTENDFRITRVGNVLRKTSLDELPQLFNVLIGDMSLVGPRPPVTYHPYKYNDYTEIQKQRFDARPGITGLAQIAVRNNASWDKRIEYDIEYVYTLGFVNDIKIFINTIFKVFFAEDVYSSLANIDNLDDPERVQVNNK